MDTQDETRTDDVAAVRRFNRFYTQKIGVLTDHMLGSPLSLSDARVLFELAQRDESTASDVMRDLGMDRGYLSRILKKLEGQGLIASRRSATDGRRRLLVVAPPGRELYESMSVRSERQVGAMLEELPAADRYRLLDAMRAIESVLTPAGLPEAPCLLRGAGPGDYGHLVQRHGELYAREFGYDEHFEALVADIVVRFITDHDPRRERLWIAEIAGRPVGSVMVVAETEELARLRLFLVEPQVRGRGVGKLLIDECLRFSRSKGYQRMTLSTVSALAAARHLYERVGFRLVREEPAHRWSQDLVDEDWELDLGSSSSASVYEAAAA